MFGLGEQHYSLVYCEKAIVKPWIIFEDSWDKLASAAAALKANEQTVRNLDPNNFLNLLKLISEPDDIQSQELSREEVLNIIAIKARDISLPAFTSKSHFQDSFQKSKYVLRTEVFQSSSAFNSGAGRHALVGPLEAKGLGRNMLSNQLDYSHSWGGQLPIDALKAVLADQICLKRTKQAPLRTIAVLLYQDTSFETQLALSYREAESYRLCQFWDDVINQHLRKIGCDHFQKVFGSISITEILDRVIEQYVHAFSVGVHHRTPTTENLTIDGRWIDTESIDFTVTPTPHAQYVQLFVPGKKIQPIVSLSEIWGLTTDVRFMGSWVHDLKFMANISHRAVKNILTPKKEINWEDLLTEKLAKFISADEKWLMLLKSHSCLREENLRKENTSNLKVIFQESLSFAGNLHCIGNFYDQFLDGTILYFSTERADMSLSSMRLLEKWNLAISKQELTLLKAFQNAELIRKAV